MCDITSHLASEYNCFIVYLYPLILIVIPEDDPAGPKHVEEWKIIMFTVFVF